MELETEKVVGEEPGQRKATRYAAVSLSPEELLMRRQEEKPVWEMILEIMKDVPEDELNKLPVDGSDEHDHYIYGTPKRNSSS